MLNVRRAWLDEVLLIVGPPFLLQKTLAIQDALKISPLAAGEWLAAYFTLLTDQDVERFAQRLQNLHSGESLPPEFRVIKAAAFKDDDTVKVKALLWYTW